MQKVTFNEIKIKDFRQAGERTFKFNSNQNYILGANGSGKTNTLHAITWCLFGKDLDDRTRFDIVPINPDNSDSELEPDVSLTISIDGEEHELRRHLQNGSNVQAYIDGAPCKTLKEFDKQVADIFSSPERFKIYTNPLFFPEMHWKKQREMFMQFFPMPSAKSVIDYMTKKKNKPKDLIADDLQKISPEQYKEKIDLEQKDIDAKRDKIRAQLELLDEQLDGQQKFDEKKFNAERKKLREKVNNINEEIAVISTNNAAIESKKNKLNYEIERLNFEISKLRNKAETEYQKEINKLEQQLELKQLQRDNIAEEYKALKPLDKICPQCGQELPKDKIDVLEAKRMHTLSNISNRGKAAAAEISDIKLKIKNLSVDPETKKTAKKEIADIEKQINEYKIELSQLEPLQEVPKVDYELIERLDELDKLLARADVYKENVKRRNDLKEQERDLNKDYETCERTLQDLADYFFYRSEMIVNAVNSQFNSISVKVLEIQKNGIPKDTFEILKDGVPYSELNTAGKLQAGLELSNFFKNEFKISCPVLIDNGERYTDVDFKKINGQLICAVAKANKKLQITNEL